ncbi:MAG: hypothetical protein ACE5MI_07225 [Acidimicrobiia bacterium]
MTTIVATLSVVNVGVGGLLTAMFLTADEVPVLVLALGIGLVAQGGYTLAYVMGLLSRWDRWTSRLLVAGQTLALVVGALGFVASFVSNINPPRGDYEYGPLAVGFLIGLHAALTLFTYAGNTPLMREEAAGGPG